MVKETVVVSSDDQVVGAIDKNSKSIIRIYRTNDNPIDSSAMTLVGLGIVVTDDGIIAADNSLISTGGNYFTTSADGKLHNLSVVQSVSGEEVALLKIKADDKNPLVLPKVTISSNDLKLGQSVVYIGGETKNVVGTGIVSSFGTKDIKSNDTASSTATSTPTVQTIITSIQTTIPAGNFVPGGLLLNLSGELVGIKSTFIDSPRTDLFAPANDISSTLANLTASQSKAQ